MTRMPKIEGDEKTIQDKCALMLAPLLAAVLMLSGVLPQVAAFKVTDHAMCKDIDWNTLTCSERANQFDFADEWAYLWLRASVESPDVGAEINFNFYDPDGRLFVGGPPTGPTYGPIAKPGEILGWMGIGVAKALMEGVWVSSDITNNATAVKQLAGLISLMRGYAEEGLVFGVLGAWARETMRPASETPGEWWAEFTLDDRVVVSERFRIGKAPMTTATPTTVTTVTSPMVTGTETQSAAAGLPSNLLMIGGGATIVVIIVLAAGYMYVRGKRR